MINTVTLNPALDKVMFLDHINRGITNRVKRMELTMGGKGTHVSMNLGIMGVPSRAFGLACGPTGRTIIDMLSEHGIETRFAYREHGESRTNYLLIEDDGTSTIVAEKGVPATEADIVTLLELLERYVEKNDFLVFSGDASNHSDHGIYTRLIKALSHKPLRVCVDASGDTLAQSLSEPLFLIKPNQDELEYLVGTPCNTEDDVLKAIRQIDREYRVEVIAISMGSAGSIVKMREGVFRAAPPTVNVLNTVGCGDSFVAGLLCGFARGLSGCETLRWGTAVSAASAESMLSVGFDIDRANALKAKCRVEKIAPGQAG